MTFYAVLLFFFLGQRKKWTEPKNQMNLARLKKYKVKIEKKKHMNERSKRVQEAQERYLEKSRRKKRSTKMKRMLTVFYEKLG